MKTAGEPRHLTAACEAVAGGSGGRERCQDSRDSPCRKKRMLGRSGNQPDRRYQREGRATGEASKTGKRRQPGS
jgi:hypothetical protein